jgi:hypothetical protein
VPKGLLSKPFGTVHIVDFGANEGGLDGLPTGRPTRPASRPDPNWTIPVGS